MASFDARFKQLRGPLSQRQAMQILDVGDKTLRDWESGSSLPSFERLVAIAEATGAPLDYIVGLSDEWEGRPKWWPPTEESGEHPSGADAALLRLGDRLASRADSAEAGRPPRRTRRQRPTPDEDPPS